jgi:hypothetical protein|tara:strand:+ start:225 stop:527 length:303 start_codon:yes stop_codon:yes gene_type:complete
MFQVEMENGKMEDVALINFGNVAGFNVHAWGDVWLVASLPDWQIIIDNETGKTVLMGEVRKKVWLQTSNPTKKKLQRPLAPLGVMVDLRAEPFTNKEVQK